MAIIYQKAEFVIDPTKPDGFISGYASKFGGVDWYGHTIDRHAYDEVIKGEKPKMFFNHMYWNDVPVGVWTNWFVDDVGLFVEGQMTLSIEKARDIYESIKSGAVDGLSVNIEMDENDLQFDDNDILHIMNVRKMREISICTFPADDKARIINVKSLTDTNDIQTIREFEKNLRDAGFSKNEACALISTAKKAIRNSNHRDDDQIIHDLENFNNMFKGK